MIMVMGCAEAIRSGMARASARTCAALFTQAKPRTSLAVGTGLRGCRASSGTGLGGALAVRPVAVRWPSGLSRCGARQSSGTRVGVDLVSVCLRKYAGMTNLIQIPAIRPTRPEMKAITNAPPMYQCGQNGISQDV
jgi:hypothetical protein